jgi:hypothetical protein
MQPQQSLNVAVSSTTEPIFYGIVRLDDFKKISIIEIQVNQTNPFI